MAGTNLSASTVLEMIYGHWRSQHLYAGVELGVFEHLPDDAPRDAESIAHEIGAEPALLCRLLRALSSINPNARSVIADFRSLRAAGY
jgi:Dimerisation domain